MMTPDEKKKIRDRHEALLNVQGRTPAEARSFLTIAARLRLEQAEAFLPDPLPRTPWSASAPGRAPPEPKRPAGHFSAPLVLGEGVHVAHRWVLAVGLAAELGCVVTTHGSETFFFSTAKEPIKRAWDALLLYTLSSELDATRALGKIPLGTDAVSVQYYRQVWMRGASSAILAERIRMTPKKKLEEAGKRTLAARAALGKVPGWIVIEKAPNDPWAPKTS